ncbi:MAG: hypothetical protein O3A81_03995 [bacterium]|nr:hypothetical protein [bacterium]
MGIEDQPNELPKDIKHHDTSSEMTDVEALFASGKIGDVLREAKLPTAPVKLPNVDAVQKHRAAQKRIPPERASKKPKKIRVVTRRPKGRQ